MHPGYVGNYLDAYRRWYVWAADAGFDGFDADVAASLEEVVIGRNPSGVAVLSHDPDSGPLRDEEMASLLSKLRAATASRELPLASLIAAWLFVAFGTNVKNVWLLNDEDLIKTTLADGSIVYEIRIPRIKKRTPGTRDQFKTRRLTPAIGQLLEEMVGENRRSKGANDPRFDQPLFRRAEVNAALIATSFARDAYRVSKGSFVEILRDVSEALDLRSSTTGSRLKLAPRRLRYTFATRLVQEGASPLELAEALDHTNTDYVMVYFNARSDIVRRLDKALALRLAPTAQAFLGLVVGSERNAVRGDDPASRIYHTDAGAAVRTPVGTCGHFGFCGLYAPVACYTCVHFQPWEDGPHEEVLVTLCADRERRLARDSDPKMTQLHDLTILAVAEVVRRCSSLQQPGPREPMV